MNRIVIIGNGFDKAHDLPTGYNDFMNHLVNSIVQVVDLPSGGKTVRKGLKGKLNKDHSGFYYRMTNSETQDKFIGAQYDPLKTEIKLVINPEADSIYFRSLFEKNEELGYWSDLEAHYFEVLFGNKDLPFAVKIINEEFEHLKRLLEEYLWTEVEDVKKNEFRAETSHSIYKMLTPQHKSFYFEKTYFVTFNYTSLILTWYFNQLVNEFSGEKYPFPPFYIHGKLRSTTNPIIFGYGDENSEEYKKLEKIGSKDLMINFKTFQYLKTNNYFGVLGLLEQTEEIYIQVIGHSCGLCDKALLRSIFEHENVKYIESTYHSDQSKHFENLYNVSRIFDDNAIMRKKLLSIIESRKVTTPHYSY